MKKVKTKIVMTDAHYALLKEACHILHLTMDECLTQLVHEFIELAIKESEDEE